jgi:hypothetical protein
MIKRTVPPIECQGTPPSIARQEGTKGIEEDKIVIDVTPYGVGTRNPTFEESQSCLVRQYRRARHRPHRLYPCPGHFERIQRMLDVGRGILNRIDKGRDNLMFSLSGNCPEADPIDIRGRQLTVLFFASSTPG